ncbi:hypothetical protein CGMCC3_g12052 [Colletotrichum fructicola]|uniref:Uncharacterized protein n=1 Tax=Colletotrichum fructicola (strain Nara gc5) TaxID=1213859 RepID=L2G3W2_COLFN|nr:uncharacterized protein CGMCC3_g12052 [Colletotrichum fructicola]KAE9571830.1 hypothetical protein CGMCC3_g12052 [Colletotrichum fructicola]KAF4428654.1 hypothetical protein CFRS1_v007433 [Colletotrichum fructicola]KAF4884427.1 hypothetical protein CGCFRS4_v012721 [Colletotrichum fructicola]KAF4932270.1 hypothetical protein CGCF245_v010775 [Colletotrichum fructicola]
MGGMDQATAAPVAKGKNSGFEKHAAKAAEHNASSRGSSSSNSGNKSGSSTGGGDLSNSGSKSGGSDSNARKKLYVP